MFLLSCLVRGNMKGAAIVAAPSIKINMTSTGQEPAVDNFW
jgi:hypothetical protein